MTLADSTNDPEVDPDAEADLRLARASNAGDRAASTELVRRLLPRARNLVRYLSQGDRDVDDLAQMASLAVLQSLGTYEGRAPIERWADRVVARSVRAALARRSHSERRAQEHAPALRVVRSTETTSTYGERRDLARALDQVPAAQREAVVLFHVVGMTMDEIATEMQVSPDTVKSRVRLGMEKLRHVLG